MQKWRHLTARQQRRTVLWGGAALLLVAVAAVALLVDPRIAVGLPLGGIALLVTLVQSIKPKPQLQVEWLDGQGSASERLITPVVEYPALDRDAILRAEGNAATEGVPFRVPTGPGSVFESYDRIMDGARGVSRTERDSFLQEVREHQAELGAWLDRYEARREQLARRFEAEVQLNNIGEAEAQNARVQLLFRADEFGDPEDEGEEAYLESAPERPRWGGGLLVRSPISLQNIRPTRAPLGLRQAARAPRGGLAGPRMYVEEGWRVVEYSANHLGARTRDRSRLEFELEAAAPGDHEVPYRVTADGIDLVVGSLQLTVSAPTAREPKVAALKDIPDLDD